MAKAAKKKPAAPIANASLARQRRAAALALRKAARGALELLQNMERDQALRLPYAGYAEAVAELHKVIGGA